MALSTDVKQALAALEQGPVKITYEPLGVNTEYIHEGGITFNFGTGREPQETDILGVYDVIGTGESLTFDLTNPESSIEALSLMFLGNVINDTSDYAGHGSCAGSSGRASAKHLRFSPQQCDGALGDVYIDVWLCIPEGDIAVAWQKDSPYTTAVTFRALPDTTKANGCMLAQFYVPNRA